MSAVLLLVVVVFGLICLSLGVMRFLLKNTGVISSIFLGCVAALCMGYLVVVLSLMNWVGSASVPETVWEYAEGASDVSPLTVPKETPLIDLSKEVDKDKDLPDWVDREPVLEGDIYKVSVVSDPKLTPLEAQADLADKTIEATSQYISDLLNAEAVAEVAVDREFVANEIQKELYLQEVDLPIGKMTIAHGLLVFDKNLRDEFRARYQATKIRWRMIQAGGLAGLLLMLIGTLFGYLKIDTATRGYYSGRLQLTAGALILAVAWAGYRLVEMQR